jgi:hypothetical protein
MAGFLVSAGAARAQDENEREGDGLTGTGLGADPFGGEIRAHYYEILKRSPAKSLLLDLALPGAGSVYTHLWGNTIVAATLSAVGAGLWIAGAVREREDLWWAGAGTFAAGRVYGLVSAPVGASLLNAAYRRHLGLVLQRQPE